MKTIFPRWVDADDLSPGAFYSEFVLGERDKTLKPSRSKMLGPINWLIKYLRWKKYIILLPELKDDKVKDAEFLVGFKSEKFDICKVSLISRIISDGPFAMRIGPEDCHFFIVSKYDVKLKVVGYVRGDMSLY